MNPGSLLGLAGLVIIGVIIADFVANPAGTSVLVNGINSIFGTALSGLLGKAPGPAPAPANRRK